MVTEQQVALDTQKQAINELKHQLTIAKETSGNEILELKKHLAAAETELSASKQQLQCEVNRQTQEVETYRDKVTTLEEKLSSLQVEYTEARRLFTEKEKHIFDQIQQLEKTKETILQELKETQFAARKQEQQLKSQVDMLSAEIEQLQGREVATATEYQGYRNVMMQKEASLLQEVESLKQQNCLTDQKLIESVSTASSLKEKLQEQIIIATSQKETVSKLEQQITVAKEISDTEIVDLKKCLCAAETELSLIKEQLQCEVNKQTQEKETYRNKVTTLEEKLASLLLEFTEVQNSLTKKEKECIDSSQQLKRLAKANDTITQELLQTQFAARQQEQQLKIQVETLSVEVEQLRGREMATSAEYQGYRNVMLQKEASLLQEVESVKQSYNKKLKDSVNMATGLEEQLKAQMTVANLQKQKLSHLEQELTISKETGSQEISKLKKCLAAAETELSASKQQLQCEVNRQMQEVEKYRDEVTTLEEKLSSLQVEYTEAQRLFSEKEKHISDQFQQLEKTKEKILQELTETQFNARKQEQQLKSQVDMLSVEIEQLQGREVATVTEYQGYQNVMVQKEASLLQEIESLKQQNCLTDQKLIESVSTTASLEEKLQEQMNIAASQKETVSKLEQELMNAKEMSGKEIVDLKRSLHAAETELSLSKEQLQGEEKKLTQEVETYCNKVTRLEQKLASLQLEYTEAQKSFAEKEKEYSGTFSQLHQLEKAKEMTLQELTQTEFVAKQLKIQVDMLSIEVEQLQRREITSAEYHSYRNAMLQKEASLVNEVESLKQRNQKLKESVDMASSLEEKLRESHKTIADLESCLQRVKDKHTMTLVSHQEAIDKEISKSQKLEAKNKQLDAELNQVKQDYLKLSQDLTRENEELVKSVDNLYSQQRLVNSQMEQDCVKKFNSLEREKQATEEQIAKLQVDMTSLLNELEGLKCAQKETNDCLNIEREKNNVLEKELQQLKVMNKAFEKENARINKLLAQQKYGPNSSYKPTVNTEQDHIQQLHSEMDETVTAHVIPSSPKESGSRFEELMARNSLIRPHLKSCYPVELQLQGGTPRSSELQLKSNMEKSSCFDVSPPRKRPTNRRKQQHQSHDSPDSVRRRLSAPPTPTSCQPTMNTQFRSHLRSYLDEEQDENRAPRRVSDMFEISLTADDKSKAKMEERRAKVLQRMTARNPPQQRVVQQSNTNKPYALRSRNTSKK